MDKYVYKDHGKINFFVNGDDIDYIYDEIMINHSTRSISWPLEDFWILSVDLSPSIIFLQPQLENYHAVTYK